MQLNDEQTKAARFGEGICIVIAVPGSGKTLTMTHRIGNLVNHMGQAPESILGLTFTRNAAEAMRQKLVPVLNDLAQRVTLSTIHSFCHNLLRCEGLMFTMLTGKEQIIFMRKIIKRLNVKELSLGMVLREISLSKNNLIDVQEFCDLYQSDGSMEKVAEIWRAYDSEKSKKMLLDFDDLLVQAHQLLRDNRDIRDKYKGTFRHLLIDEYQDINPLQFEIIKLLANDKDIGASFWACGDDWQSIYAFTGASVANIINFTQMFPDAQQLILNLNYRSTPQILTACHNLIRHNEKRIDKQLRTDNLPGNDVIVLESSSEETEALAILNEVRDLVERKGLDYADIAILYRCNFQSRVIEEAFCQHNIPYHIENGLCFYDRREVKLLLDYLRLIIDPMSDAGDEALKSIINVPNRYIGKKFILEMEQFQAGSDQHLFEKLKRLPIDLPYLRVNVRQFISLMQPLMEDAHSLQPAEVIHLASYGARL
jgi:DNA helicase II / ATP-dependent DNA helicase PcrA